MLELPIPLMPYKVCVPNKTEHLDVSVFTVILEINGSKTLIRHISYRWKYKFEGRKCNSNQKWNNDKFQCQCEKHNIWEKDYNLNPGTCSCKNS